MVVLFVSTQRSGIAVALPTTLRVTLEWFLVAVGQHVAVAGMKEKGIVNPLSGGRKIQGCE